MSDLDPFVLDLAEKLEHNYTYDEVEEILNKKGPFQVPLQWVIYFGTHEFKNDWRDLQTYLSTPDNPVSTEEFLEFWKATTVRERIEFKDAEL